MQTFLPYPGFEESALALDTRRLGKQRVETLQIARALTRPGHGFRHHPAVRMWRGYEEALGAYGVAICREWRRRGYADTCEVKIMDDLTAAGVPVPVRAEPELRAAGGLPPWLGDEALHRSHRSALVRKDPEFYGPQFGDVPADLPYVWPDGAPAT
ncbi:MAG TPA: MSMEG_6728 family protein [Streptosporangiaceae bacterium]